MVSSLYKSVQLFGDVPSKCIVFVRYDYIRINKGILIKLIDWCRWWRKQRRRLVSWFAY